jgi:hypothetical protein
LEIGEKGKEFGFAINQKIWFLPDLVDEKSIGLAVYEETPELLVTLVYDILCFLSEILVDMENDPNDLLFSYCNAIEFLRSQIEEQGSINNTVFMKKVKVRAVNERIEPVYKWVKRQKVVAPEEEQEIEFGDDAKEEEEGGDEVTVDHILASARALLTTPKDRTGREKRMMQHDDDDDL